MQQTGTYQTRISDYGSVNRSVGDAALDAYAALYGLVQRRLFADVPRRVGSVASLKSAYLKRHGIPARMFNASAGVPWKGRSASVKEQQKLRVGDLQRRIARAERQIADAAEHGRLDQVHQKKRRLANLRHRLSALEADIAAGRVRLCFGSKRLWRKQHNLEANGYASHEEWLRDWRDSLAATSSSSWGAGMRRRVASSAWRLLLMTVTLTLRLRMPNCLAGQHDKYVVIEGVWFAYGHEQVLAALQSNADYAAYRQEHGEKRAREIELGQAVSYRFKRDEKGWRVFVTTNMMGVPVVTDQRLGAIGVDLNADHLAVAETDASGQLPERLAGAAGPPMARALIRPRLSSATAVASVVECAQVRSGKPIVIERLDFRQKKAAFWKVNPAGTAGCCRLSATARSRRTSSPAATVREWRYIRSTRPTVR